MKAQDEQPAPAPVSIKHTAFERNGGVAQAITPRLSMLRGYGDFSLAPPHNEPDPGICGTTSPTGTIPCTAFARYVAYGHIEIRPFINWPKVLGVQLNSVYLFSDASLLLGNNVPKQNYTWSADAIGLDKSWGLVIALPRGFEVRVTQHPPFSAYQRYNQSSGYIGPNGPWGRFSTVGVRKYFGYHGLNGGPE